MIKPKNDRQKQLINATQTYDLVLCTGPAGTGKTFIAANLAAEALASGAVRKVVLTRPNIPVQGSGSIGYFPGELNDKMTPWLSPVLKTLEECLGKGAVEYHLKKGSIELVPFEVIRGRSFEDSFIILDEAQNVTIPEIQAFVTRQGTRSKCIIDGDVTQTDLGDNSGLAYIVDIFNNNKAFKKHVALVEFDVEDIVRSGLCYLWVKAFMDESQGRLVDQSDVPHFLRPFDRPE